MNILTLIPILLALFSVAAIIYFACVFNSHNKEDSNLTDDHTQINL
jgi:flagellar basal body-associated protein FliL